jgi:hypothetical protein
MSLEPLSPQVIAQLQLLKSNCMLTDAPKMYLAEIWLMHDSIVVEVVTSFNSKAYLQPNVITQLYQEGLLLQVEKPLEKSSTMACLREYVTKLNNSRTKDTLETRYHTDIRLVHVSIYEALLTELSAEQGEIPRFRLTGKSLKEASLDHLLST